MKILIFILFLPLQLISQNLVLNPSFEKSQEDCANEIGLFGEHLNSWFTPTLGTSDVFNACGKNRTGIPYNFNGHQHTKFGEKYAGCFFFAGKNYREYIQGEFSARLEKGKKYRISFYISLAEVSGVAIKSIGYLLTKEKFKIQTSGSVSERQLKRNNIEGFSLHHIDSESFYDDKNEWMLVTHEFVANGKEKFLTVGNFHNDFRTQKKILSNSRGIDKSYYYIDMIQVESVDNIKKEEEMVEEEIEPEIDLGPELISDPKEMEFDKSYIFENIMFDFNSTKLGVPAKDQIKSIYDFLLEKDYITLIITGHTDSIGGNEYNQILSKNRAEAVAGYLVELGLGQERIKVTAFGKSEPLTSNKTDKGRSLNRRVEFKITKQ